MSPTRRTLKQRVDKLEEDAMYAARKADEWRRKSTAKQELAERLKREIAEAAE